MSQSSSPAPAPQPGGAPQHRRRPRYSGKYPRRFEDRYKELNPERYPETRAKVIAAGKTPAGMHRSIMVREILEALAPAPGETAVDCTLGYGGHAMELLNRLRPGGRLIGLDADPIELPKTEARLRGLGYGPDCFAAYRTNFAGLPQVLAARQLTGVDVVLADLGVSSMQLDDPARGFGFKQDGPLDMRLNPHRGCPASTLLAEASPAELSDWLTENADEPHAIRLADALAGREFPTTGALRESVRRTLRSEADADASVRRVFQALRIAVNDEFSVLEALLRHIPGWLNRGGRVAILSFHSGEDRRIKKAFEAGLREGHYSAVASEVQRASPTERHANPRSAAAKLRWARAPAT